MDCLFCYETKYKAVFTVLKLFYLVILSFKESLFLELGNTTEVIFNSEEVFLNLAMYQDIRGKPHYCINIGLQGYFE